MLGKNLSEALGGIGEEKITAAMKVYEKKRQKRSLWLRVGAAAATLAILLTAALWPRQTTDGQIITAPGVLKVYAYDWTQSDDIEVLEQCELTSQADYFCVIYIPYVSATIKTPFTFEFPQDYYGEAQITFEVSSEFDAFCKGITVKNGEGIVLDSHALAIPLSEIYNQIGENKNFYLDVLIRADGNVVGYGTIAFCFDEGVCMAYRLETVCYPLVEKKYQEVTEEYVRTQIAEYKKLHENDELPSFWSDEGGKK